MFISLLSVLLSGCNSSEESIKYYNSTPIATITSHSNEDELLEGVEYTFVGMVSDDNHSSTELSVTWSTDTRELCAPIQPDVEGTTYCQATLEAGETKLKLQVSDPDSAAGLASIDISVQETQAPTITLLSPDANTQYYADQLIEFSAIISDEEDDATNLQYQWESSQDGILSISSPPDTDGTISSFASLSEGQHAITLRVEDTTGKISSQDIAIMVGGVNANPVCSIVEPTSGQGFTFSQNVTFSGTATDEDINNSLLTISWESDIDGVINSTAPNSDGEVAFVYDALSMGNHTITLKVNDEAGGICSDTVLVSIGTPPTLTITAPSSGSIVSQGESVFFEGTVSDQEDIASSLLFSWESDIDGVFSTQGSDSYGNIALGYSNLSTGTHNITITATDSDGLSAIHTQSLMVNTPPPAPSVSITPTTPNNNDDLNAVVIEQPDADGNPITFSYAWLKDGALTSYTSTSVPASATNGNETWTIQVTPNDGYVDGDIAQASVTVTNSAPSVIDVQITPSIPYNDSTLTCVENAVDPDNDPLTTTYEWNNTSTGTMLGTGSTLTLDSSMASRNDVISCSVTVSDPSGENATNSNTTTLQNRAPNAPNISISPNPAYVGNALVCTINTTSDPDDDSTTEYYTWLVNGTTLSENSNTLSTGFGLSDTVECQVISNDGFLDGSTGSDSITISNEPPILTSISLSPTNPTTTNSITASIQYTDPEGMPVTETYEWSVDGTVVQTGSTATLDASFFSKDQEVFVTAVVNDGISDSAPMDAAITILNTPPSEPIIDITPANPIEQLDDLTCSVTSTSTDADQDTITYLFSWTVDGLAYNGANSTGLSSTVSATETSQGELWECSVLPNDGDDDGPSAIIDITIVPDTYDSCLSIYYSNSNSADGVYSIDINASGTEIDVYCDMTNGGQTYEDFGMGQYNTTYSGWERLGVTDFQNLQVASALSYFYNRQLLTNVGVSWNSNNCCFIDPNSSQPYYGFGGSNHIYPALSSGTHCNAGYHDSSYHISSGNTGSVFTSLSTSQIQNVGTYNSCSTSGNPAIFVKRWY